MDLDLRKRREQLRHSGVSFGDNQNNSDISFPNTAMALLILLEHLSERDLGISLDLAKKQIIDITEFGDKRIVVGPSRTKWFFEWLSLEPATANHAKQLMAGHHDSGS